MSGLLIGSYLGIGAITTGVYFKIMNNAIEKYEDGENLDDDSLDYLDSLRKMNKLTGGKSTVFVIGSSLLLFWLPLLSYALIKAIKDLIAERK